MFRANLKLFEFTWIFGEHDYVAVGLQLPEKNLSQEQTKQYRMFAQDTFFKEFFLGKISAILYFIDLQYGVREVRVNGILSIFGIRVNLYYSLLTWKSYLQQWFYISVSQKNRLIDTVHY